MAKEDKLLAEIEAIKKEMATKQEVESLRSDIENIIHNMERYKGLVGGAAWTIGVMGAGLVFLWDVIKHFFKGN